MKKFLSIILILSNFSFAQSFLSNKIDSILTSVNGLNQVGIKIIDADSNKTIYEKNSHLLLSPASTVKLFTTSTALKSLGKNFKLALNFYSTKNPVNGIINGDIVIKTFANPFVKDSTLDSIAVLFNEMGIRKINGNIICDNSYFNKDFIEEFYGKYQREVITPPIDAAVINRNEIRISFIPQQNGKPYNYKIFPKSKFYKVNFLAKFSKRFHIPRINLDTKPKEISITIKGKIKRSKHTYTFSSFIDNPSLFIANIFYEKLQTNGIEITGLPKAEKNKNSSYLLFSLPVTLEKIIEKTNKESDNFLAEIILNTLGAEFCNCPGNPIEGINAIKKFLIKNKLPLQEIKLFDGSGISRKNKFTANAVVELLKTIYDDPENFNTFYSSLASAGLDGTLEERLVGFGLKNNFHGKTGTLNGISAISGYLTTLSGKNVILSMIFHFNSHGAEYWREIQDEIIVDITTAY